MGERGVQLGGGGAALESPQPPLWVWGWEPAQSEQAAGAFRQAQAQLAEDPQGHLGARKPAPNI